MQNVTTKVSDKGILTVTVDLNQPGVKSESGKTLVIASTRGNADIHETPAGKIKLGLNVYLKPNAA